VYGYVGLSERYDQYTWHDGSTLGRFSLEALSNVPMFIADLQSRIDAFCTWLPYGGGKAVVLDLMRKRAVTVAGTMDYLLAHSLLQLRAEEYTEARGLANAPPWPTCPNPPGHWIEVSPRQENILYGGSNSSCIYMAPEAELRLSFPAGTLTGRGLSLTSRSFFQHPVTMSLASIPGRTLPALPMKRKLFHPRMCLRIMEY
jgi:hypothetical protein